ncbi:MAG: ATP-binding protein, partial [Nitrospirota bacterium]
ASRGVSRDFICAERCIPLGECLCGQAAMTGALVSSPDVAAEPRLVRAACRNERFGSVASIPLTAGERTLGVLTVYAARPGAFSSLNHETLALVGRHIGVAVDNAQLYARAREQAVAEERGFMAREIHDGIAQSLAYLNLQVRQLKELLPSGDPHRVMAELDQIRRVVEETYAEARELLVDFRAAFKPGECFLDALNRHLSEFSRRTAIGTRLIAGPDLGPLPSGAQMPLFRIIQEALSNVRRHAGARQVTVELTAGESALEVAVRDDGCGFDAEAQARGGSAHFGLQIMRERAARLGGSVRIESQAGRGTTVRLRVARGAPGE